MRKIIFVFLAVFLFLILILASVLMVKPSSVFGFKIKPEEPKFSREKDIEVILKPLGLTFRLTKTERYKSSLHWSPDKKRLAFFEDIEDLTGKIDYDKAWAINVIDARTLRLKKVFIGDYHASSYEWISDKIIRVFVSAGSGVRIFRDLDIGAKEPFIFVENSSPDLWSPVLDNRY
ncbi:MAG: hypothetical protein UV40_C0002G0017 [Parcubacteria group bacterium GW2011_GWA1_42_7]|nr:MAG: hypothetical protein UV34_C0009G0013 [Parcubacteria group bacterium GW2011_GWB1_42_6]KKS70213.1 MAG: hypothetical protein UV40_C0002G0017 [Parcubacteria group bacterium GW2011_GWA1_42_7]KKS92470.1 MAG: hypothetical protein UV67_C0003G0022 [Parcubacteria group bacterium GW2011_GWC1_43_12]